MVSGRNDIEQAVERAGEAPVISVVMANYQGAMHLDAALRSVARQSFKSLEIIVSDDASSDASVAIVRAAMQADSRIRLIEASANGGPGRARNRAFDQARGEWIAIVDSDDLLHPERFQRLLAAAGHLRADIIADDLLHFSEGPSVSYLLDDSRTGPIAVAARDWILAGTGGTPPLGYVKPMIRASVLGATRYDEALRIGEDFDLILRLLLAGARFEMIPEPWYLYRRHEASISHRLSTTAMEAMVAAQQAVVDRLGPFEASVAEAFTLRMLGLRHDLDFELLMAAIKARRGAEALHMLARRPALVSRLVAALAARSGRARGAGRALPFAGRRPVHLAEMADGAFGEGRHAATIVQPVPPRPRLQDTQWGQHRRVWKRVAALAASGHEVTWEGEAGRYAAGFVPDRGTGKAQAEGFAPGSTDRSTARVPTEAVP